MPLFRCSEPGDGHRAPDRTHERDAHQPPESRSSGVAEQQHTCDARYHRLPHDEGGGGAVHRTQLKGHGEEVEAAQVGDRNRPGRGIAQQDTELQRVDSLEHAINLTNASPYGLLAAIFTADLQNGLEFADRVRTGWVNINESSNYWEPHLPFGGRAGTASGIGRVGGSAPKESFTELQTVVIS